jgi:hypothetical protein
MSILTFIIGLVVGFIVTIAIEFSLVWLLVIRDNQSDDMKS